MRQVIDLDLLGIEHRSVVLHTYDFSTLNPGYVNIPGFAGLATRTMTEDRANVVYKSTLLLSVAKRLRVSVNLRLV